MSATSKRPARPAAGASFTEGKGDGRNIASFELSTATDGQSIALRSGYAKDHKACATYVDGSGFHVVRSAEGPASVSGADEVLGTWAERIYDDKAHKKLAYDGARLSPARSPSRGRRGAARRLMSVMVITRFRVVEPAAFVDRVDTALAVLRARAGFLDATLERNLDEPGLWALVTRWANVGSYRRALQGYEAKTVVVPLLSEALDEPSAYEDPALQ